MAETQDGLPQVELEAHGVDVAVAANANVAAPISGDALHHAAQTGGTDGSDEPGDGTGTGGILAGAPTEPALPGDVVASINGAVAANANVAAPIDDTPTEAAET